MLEDNVRNFQGNWTGTGTIENPGTADTERAALEADQYMESEIIDTGLENVELLQNVYATGDDVLIRYRHGATPGDCAAASWNDYTIPFASLGYVQVRIASTL